MRPQAGQGRAIAASATPFSAGATADDSLVCKEFATYGTSEERMLATRLEIVAPVGLI
jgi:hypothetical protein